MTVPQYWKGVRCLTGQGTRSFACDVHHLKLVRADINYSILWCITYCKRGYFRRGKISQKCWQDLSRRGNFHDISSISLIKSYGFFFPTGEIFAKKAISRKTRKLPPRENVHVYSIVIYLYVELINSKKSCICFHHAKHDQTFYLIRFASQSNFFI